MRRRTRAAAATSASVPRRLPVRRRSPPLGCDDAAVLSTNDRPTPPTRRTCDAVLRTRRARVAVTGNNFSHSHPHAHSHAISSSARASKWDGMRWYATPALPWMGKNHIVTSFQKSIIPVSLCLNGLNTSQKSQARNWNYAVVKNFALHKRTTCGPDFP